MVTVRLAGETPEPKRQVGSREEVSAVREKHARRHVWRHPTPRRRLQLDAGPQAGVFTLTLEGAKHVVVNRHEQAKVGVDAAVVKRVVGRGVNQVLEPRHPIEEGAGHELPVAVPYHVQHVEHRGVQVKGGERAAACVHSGQGRSAAEPSAQHRHGEVGSVADGFEERVAGATHGFRHEGLVVVRVVFGKERVAVQRPVEPVVNELRGAHVKKEHFPEPIAVKSWKGVEARHEPVHRRHDVHLNSGNNKIQA